MRLVHTPKSELSSIYVPFSLRTGTAPAVDLMRLGSFRDILEAMPSEICLWFSEIRESFSNRSERHVVSFQNFPRFAKAFVQLEYNSKPVN